MSMFFAWDRNSQRPEFLGSLPFNSCFIFEHRIRDRDAWQAGLNRRGVVIHDTDLNVFTVDAFFDLVDSFKALPPVSDLPVEFSGEYAVFKKDFDLAA